MTTISVTARGYTADLDTATGRVSISDDSTGCWAGSGHWDGSSIADCPAILGGSQDAADDIYDELDAALTAALADGAEPAPRKYLNRKHATHKQAVAYLQERGGGYVELVTKDATRQHWTYTGCFLDSHGELQMPHPTDPKGARIAAPTDGRYRIPTEEDYAELAARFSA